LQTDHLRSAGEAVEADPQQEEQVLRVQGTVQAGAVPRLHDGPRLPADQRRGARFVRRRPQPHVPEARGRVHDGHRGPAAQNPADPRARVPQQEDHVARVPRHQRHQLPHGQVPRAVRPVEEAAGRQNQVQVREREPPVICKSRVSLVVLLPSSSASAF